MTRRPPRRQLEQPCPWCAYPATAGVRARRRASSATVLICPACRGPLPPAQVSVEPYQEEP